MHQRFFGRVFLLALVLSGSCSISRGTGTPNIEFSQRFGTDSDDGAMGIATDPAGNVYVSGYTYGDLTSPHSSNGAPRMNNGQAFLRKHDTQGTLLWSTVLSGPQGESGWSVAADKLGNVFMMGVTKDNLFGTNAGSWDIYLTKYNDAGVFQWGRQFGTSGAEWLGGLSADNLGNVYISGMTDGSLGGPNAGKNDAFLVKYNSGGDRAWTRQFGNSLEQSALDVHADGRGHVYVSGDTEGNLAGPNAGGADMFAAKYDDAGNREWIRQLGTSGYEGGMNVSSDNLGNVYVSGDTNGNLAGLAGQFDVFLVKYDSAGSRLWMRQWGSNKSDNVGSDAMAMDNAGDIYITGFTRGYFAGPLGGSTDIFLSKIDNFGTQLWHKQIDLDYIDTSPSVATDGFGNIYLSGETRVHLEETADGISDAFLMKISEVPEPNSIVLTIVGIWLGCTYSLRTYRRW